MSELEDSMGPLERRFYEWYDHQSLGVLAFTILCFDVALLGIMIGLYWLAVWVLS